MASKGVLLSIGDSNIYYTIEHSPSPENPFLHLSLKVLVRHLNMTTDPKTFLFPNCMPS